MKIKQLRLLESANKIQIQKVESVDSSYANGSHKLAVLNGVPYSKLVELFGEPESEQGGEAFRVDWTISITYQYDNWTPETIIVTIYDWNSDHESVQTETQWNVGGFDQFHFHVLDHFIKSKMSQVTPTI